MTPLRDQVKLGVSLLFWNLAIGPACDYALPFLNRNGLKGIHISKLVYLSTGPLNFNAVCFGLRAQAEGQH